MLGQPSLISGYDGCDTQGQALLAQKGVSAVTGSIRPDCLFLRKMRNVFFIQGRAGPETGVILAGKQRLAD
jgi:hypothetical protein